jgi:hypothetical protein
MDYKRRRILEMGEKPNSMLALAFRWPWLWKICPRKIPN